MTATADQYLRVFRRFSVSAVTVTEIVEGLTRQGKTGAATEFLQDAEKYEILSIEAEEAVLAGQILGLLAREGQKIGDYDPFIAAAAITHGLPLVTNNVRHYQRIVNLGFPLVLDNWRAAPAP